MMMMMMMMISTRDRCRHQWLEHMGGRGREENGGSALLLLLLLLMMMMMMMMMMVSPLHPSMLLLLPNQAGARARMQGPLLPPRIVRPHWHWWMGGGVLRWVAVFIIMIIAIT